MPKVIQFNEGSISPDMQKVIDAWEKSGMSITPGRGWKFSGAESGPVKLAAKALGVSNAEKMPWVIGVKYKVGSVTLAFAKSSRGHVKFINYTPQ